MRVYIIAFGIFCACQTTPTFQEKEIIKGYLSQYEISKDIDFKKVTQNVTDILFEIASDPNEKRFYRARALEQLKYHQEERVFYFLTSWSYEEEPFLSAVALSSLASVAGPEHKELVQQKLDTISLDAAKQLVATPTLPTK